MLDSPIALLALLALAACGSSFGEPPPGADPADWARVGRLLDAPGVRLTPSDLPVPGDPVGALWAVGYRVSGHPVGAGVYRLPDGADPESAAARLLEARGERREEMVAVANGPLLLVTVRGEIDMAGGDPETTRARDALLQAFEEGRGGG